MKDLLEFITKEVVSKPEEIKIDESTTDGVISINLKVSDDDFGTIIGKGGRTIKAIRDVLRLRTQKDNTRYSLNIEEPSKKLDAD